MTHREKILNLLLAKGEHGATDAEGSAETGIAEHVYRARRGALAKESLVGSRDERRDGRLIYLHVNWVPPEAIAREAERRAERAHRRSQREAAQQPPATAAPDAPSQPDLFDNDPLFA